MRAGHGILAVRGDFAEAEFAVHRDRVFHDWFDGIEPHALVSDLAGFGDDAIRQSSAQAFAAKLRAQVEALHFTDTRIQFVEGDAARELAVVVGKEKAAIGRGVVSGEICKLFVEALKAEAESQGLRVFQEEFAGLGDLGRRLRLNKSKTLYHRGHRGHRGFLGNCMFCIHFLCVLRVLCGEVFEVYPISMPPFTFRTWPVM